MHPHNAHVSFTFDIRRGNISAYGVVSHSQPNNSFNTNHLSANRYSVRKTRNSRVTIQVSTGFY